MARKIRSNYLENRTNRLKLPVSSKPIYVRIGPSLTLGYRRNQTAGMWVMRVTDGKGGMRTQSIGHADDYEQANGQSFLTFFEAQDRARKLQNDDNVIKPLTVGEAAKHYLIVLKSKNSHTAYDTKLRLNKHFLPAFKDKLVSSLTKTMLESWLSSLVNKSNERASKDTANRVLTMVKALLNHAMLDKSYRLKDDTPWRLVKPFKQVSQPRSIRYTNEEVMRLIAFAPDIATANLIKAAFLTGTRYGEMKNSLVSSVDIQAKTWTVAGKTGSRTILLQSSAVDFFAELINGRNADRYLFVREDGSPWKSSDQTRPFKEAILKAGLPVEGSIYALRHTYISVAIEGQVPLTVIARNSGTSVRMIEKTYAKVLNEKERAFIESGTPSFGLR